MKPGIVQDRHDSIRRPAFVGKVPDIPVQDGTDPVWLEEF